MNPLTKQPTLHGHVENGAATSGSNPIPGFTPPSRMRRRVYQCLAGVGLLLWVGLFTAGATVSSAPYRATLQNSLFNWPDLFNAMVFWSPTNVCLLSMLAALIGGCASGSMLAVDLLQRIADAKATPGQEKVIHRLTRRLWYMYESPAVSMVRGLFVYVIFISGLLVVDTKPFVFDNDADAQAAYLRLAGLLSAFAFVFGFDPSKCEDMIDRVGPPGNRAP